MSSEILVPTAERTLRLIELLHEQPDGFTPQELLLHLDISRSSLFLLLRTLKKLGYVEQAEKRGRYRLGPRLGVWRSAPSPPLQDLLSAFYQEATRQTWPETLALAVKSAGSILILAQVEGSAQVRSVFTPGQIYPSLKATAEVLDFTPPEKVQANGYSIVSTEESLELALPICRDGCQPEAALILNAPIFRWEPRKILSSFLTELRVMAARLSYQLGAPTYTPYRDRSEHRLKPTTQLTTMEISEFLQGPWAARLACIRPDGHPHVIPVWQEWDGEAFYVIALHGSQWAEHLLRNPSVSLSVDEPWPPLRRVVVRGQAELLSSHERSVDLDNLLGRLTRRYLGKNAIGLAGKIECAFRIFPEYMSGWQGSPTTLSVD